MERPTESAALAQVLVGENKNPEPSGETQLSEPVIELDQQDQEPSDSNNMAAV